MLFTAEDYTTPVPSIRDFPHTFAEYRRRFVWWMEKRLRITSPHLARHVSTFVSFFHWRPISNDELRSAMKPMFGVQLIHGPQHEECGPHQWWDTSEVTSMCNLCSGHCGTSFLSELRVDLWCTSNVTDMSGMFQYCTDFDQPIGDWDVGKVTDMSNMFEGARMFNQPLNKWDVRQLQRTTTMFRSAAFFNQPLDEWNVAELIDAEGMFLRAHSFNQPLRTWKPTRLENMSSMFFGSDMSPQNAASVVGWHVPRLQKNFNAFDSGIFWSECMPSNMNLRLTCCMHRCEYIGFKCMTFAAKVVDTVVLYPLFGVLLCTTICPLKCASAACLIADELLCLQWGRPSCVDTCTCIKVGVESAMNQSVY